LKKSEISRLVRTATGGVPAVIPQLAGLGHFLAVNAVDDGVVEHQVAARDQSVEEALDDRVGLVGVHDVFDGVHHHQGDGRGEIQRPGSLAEDGVGVAGRPQCSWWRLGGAGE
jgi:hypothetical protein